MKKNIYSFEIHVGHLHVVLKSAVRSLDLKKGICIKYVLWWHSGACRIWNCKATESQTWGTLSNEGQVKEHCTQLAWTSLTQVFGAAAWHHRHFSGIPESDSLWTKHCGSITSIMDSQCLHVTCTQFTDVAINIALLFLCEVVIFVCSCVMYLNYLRKNKLRLLKSGVFILTILLFVQHHILRHTRPV